MRIVIAGCGRVGSDLARSLADGGHDVSVIDQTEAAVEQLGSTFNGSTHVGVAYDVDVQESAGIKYADVFVAVTNSDNANLMSVQVAETVFEVPKAIARLDDPSREDAYRALNVSYVAGSKLVANVIYQQIVEHEFAYHLTFGGGDVEIVEMTLGPEAEGVSVAELEMADRFRVAAVRRDGTTHIPDPEFDLQDGDFVVAAARKGTSSKLRRYLEAD